MSDTAYQTTQQSLSTPVQSAESATSLPAYTQSSGNTAVQDELGLANGVPATPANLDAYLQSNPQDTELVLSAAGPAVAIPAAFRNDYIPEVDAWLDAQSLDDILAYGQDEADARLAEVLPVGEEWTVAGGVIAAALGGVEGNVEATIGCGKDGLLFRVQIQTAEDVSAGVGVAAGQSAATMVDGAMVSAQADVSQTQTLTWYLDRSTTDLLTLGSAIVRGLLAGNDLVGQLTAAFEAVAKTPPAELRSELGAGVSASGGVAAGVPGAGMGAAAMSASAGAFVATGFDGAGEAFMEIGIRGEADIEAWAGQLGTLGVLDTFGAVVPSLFKDGTNGAITLRVHAPISEAATLDPSVASFTVSATAGDWSQSVEAESLSTLPAAIEALFGDVPVLESEATEGAFCGQLSEADVPDRAFTTTITRDGRDIEAARKSFPEEMANVAAAQDDMRGLESREMDAVLTASVEVPSNAITDVVISEDVEALTDSPSAICGSIADAIGHATLAGERLAILDNPGLDVTGYADEAALTSASLVVTDKQGAGIYGAVAEGPTEQVGMDAAFTHTTTIDLTSVPFSKIRELAA